MSVLLGFPNMPSRSLIPSVVFLVALAAAMAPLGSFAEEASIKNSDIQKPEKRDLEELVPLNLLVSVGDDRLFGAVRLQIVPAQLGLDSWARWDRDGDGALNRDERMAAAEAVTARVLPSFRVALAGKLLALDRAKPSLLGPKEQLLALDARLLMNVSAKTSLAQSPGAVDEAELPFVIYAVPLHMDGIVPLSVRLGSGLQLVGADGTRTEILGPGRLEAVTTRATPALWGRLKRRSGDSASPP